METIIEQIIYFILYIDYSRLAMLQPTNSNVKISIFFFFQFFSIFLQFVFSFGIFEQDLWWKMSAALRQSCGPTEIRVFQKMKQTSSNSFNERD